MWQRGVILLILVGKLELLSLSLRERSSSNKHSTEFSKRNKRQKYTKKEMKIIQSIEKEVTGREESRIIDFR